MHCEEGTQEKHLAGDTLEEHLEEDTLEEHLEEGTLEEHLEEGTLEGHLEVGLVGEVLVDLGQGILGAHSLDKKQNPAEDKEWYWGDMAAEQNCQELQVDIQKWHHMMVVQYLKKNKI